MLISKELLSKIKKIQIKTDRMASEILSGEYKSAFKGTGLNFDAIRDYQVGDDLRLIDWKVTARSGSGTAAVRQYKEERQLTIMLIVDFSASNAFGSQEKNKRELTIELASVLASLATKNNDKVGMLLVTDTVEAYIPAKQGKAHIFRMIKELLLFEPKSKKTNFKNVLTEALQMIPKRSVVFMISDFISSKTSPSKLASSSERHEKLSRNDLNSEKKNFDYNFDFEKEMKLLSRTQDFIAVSIRDPFEFNLPKLGFLELVDPETGHVTLMNLNRKSVREKYTKSQKAHLAFLKDKFKKMKIDFLNLSTQKAYIHDLLMLFLTREKRN
jgi:hypothetical protein